MHSVIPGVPTAPPAPSIAADPQDVRQPRSTAHDHDIFTTAEASPKLAMFVDFIRAAGLESLLHQAELFTVFAPTDRAFLKLSLRERDSLLADPRRLERMMRGHVVPGRLLLHSTDSDSVAVTIDGEHRRVTATNGTHVVERVRIVQANIHASNGVIHAIDSLLL